MDIKDIQLTPEEINDTKYRIDVLDRISKLKITSGDMKAIGQPIANQATLKALKKIKEYMDTYCLRATYVARPDIECIGVSKTEYSGLVSLIKELEENK